MLMAEQEKNDSMASVGSGSGSFGSADLLDVVAASPAAFSFSSSPSSPLSFDGFLSALDNYGARNRDPNNHQRRERPAPAGTAHTDDSLDPKLQRALLNAFVEVIPTGTSALDKESFLEILDSNNLPQRGKTAEGFSSSSYDRRWQELYTHPVLIACGLWFGARALLDRGSNEGAADMPTAADLGRLIPKLETRFVRILRHELARFWAEASPRKNLKSSTKKSSPESLHTLENLALLFTLGGTVSFLVLQMARLDAARVLSKHIVAMLRCTRIPGEIGIQTPKHQGIDDVLIEEHWRDVFWTTVAMESLLAATSGTKLAFDPVREFPTVPLSLPAMTLADIPPPSKREINGPIPDEILNYPPFRCRDYLGYLDPAGALPPEMESRESALRRSFGDYRGGGPPFIGFVMFFALYQVSAFLVWLKEEAHISMLGVLAAEELVQEAIRPPEVQRVGTDESASSGGTLVAESPPPAMGSLPRQVLRTILLRKPLLKEAIRRRNFLWDAISLIEEALPQPLVKASENSDYDTLAAMLAPLPGDSAQLVFGILAMLRQLLMMLVSPEPFADLLEGQDGDGKEAATDLDDDSTISSLAPTDHPDVESTMLHFWFSSPSFFDASRNAIIISANLKMLSTRFASRELDGNYLLFMCACTSATHAAWLHLLILRRYAALVSTSSAEEQSGAVQLYAELRSDIEACLEFLDASGQPQYAHAASLLRGILEGQAVKLTEDDLETLRIAQKGARFCEHVEGATDDGSVCYLCQSERSKGKKTGLDKEGRPIRDPLAQLPEYQLGERLKKSVKFSEEVSEHETYTKEEYPARSMRAVDSPIMGFNEERNIAEGEVKTAGEKGLESSGPMNVTTLGFMLQQRGLLLK